MSKVRKGQAFLLSSATGKAHRVNSPLLVDKGLETAAYCKTFKSVLEGVSKADVDGASKSQKLTAKWGQQVDGVEVAARPFDFGTYAFAAVVNTYHARAIEVKSSDITGRAWQIASEGQDAAKEEAEQFFKNSFGAQPFKLGIKCVWKDYESLGNGYFEIKAQQGDAGKPGALDHLPATQMWVRLDGLGFVQQLGTDHSHFRNFLAPQEAFEDLKEGDPLADPKKYGFALALSNYSPFSMFYGLPSIMPAMGSLGLWELVREYNVSFFSNNAIPDYAVILEGEWEDDADQVIEQYFESHLKGKAHKTLVLMTPTGGKVTFQKLTSDDAKEGSFRLLKRDCRDEIIHAHGVPPQKIGIVETGALGGNVGKEQLTDYKESIVKPGQELLADTLTAILTARGDEKLAFEFEPFDDEDKKAGADVDAIYIDKGVKTPAEVRTERFPDLEELPDDGAANAAAAEPLTEAVGELQKSISELQREVA